MKIPKIIHNAVAGYIFRNTDERTLRVVAATKSGNNKGLSDQTEKEAINMQAKTLADWKLALTLASDPEEPNFSDLEKLYQNLELDNHLVATIENRIEPVQGTPFKFTDQSGKENEEAKELFEAMWFIDFVGICLRSKFQGTKVVELYDLDENMYLKGITEISKAHAIPAKGIITKEAGGTTGWNYKEGAFADQYIQIGKDDFLGMYAQLAPIVLAKKLGFGSWLDYIEKYGVPPIFAITDREDQARLDQLYNALLNFKSNNFMVGRGQEKFEIGKDTGGGSFDIFDKLIERANSELSKRILGGTGTSDEKSHVGAAKVHAAILATKHKLDKFFVKVIINNQLIPRLVKISPVYAPLANLKFEWDDTENLTLDQYIAAVKDLSAYYEIDVEELATRTGIPITGLKKAMVTPSADPEPKPEPQKKK
ncbi:phage portal protein family protein [Aquimarina muelleri]|uniref:phage portal protein family protein n=1 Tax=Aquimarina muelleri TaxID=279356 RepID=UPI003F68740F